MDVNNQPQEHNEEEIDLRDYLRVLRKRKWTILAVFALIVLTVTIYSFSATPIYESSTRLIIEKENPNVMSIDEVMAVDASGTDYYQTQYKIIESRTVARNVVEKLQLEDTQEFNPDPADDFLSRWKRTVQETVNGWKESLTSLLRTRENEPPVEALEGDAKVLDQFAGRLTVDPIRNSRLVDIRFQAKDPLLATQIANTIARVYIEKNLETKLEAVQDAVSWLHERIEDERQKVETAEQALLRYKEKHGIITDFSSDTEQITAQKLAKLNEQLVDAESQRVEAETRYRQAKALEGNPDMLDSVSEVVNSELIREIKKMEVELFKRLSELSEKYGQKHPRIIAIKSELDTLENRKRQEINRIVSSLRNEYQVALARERSLRAALGRQKQESLDLNQKAVEYTVLRRQAESARQMYDLLINRFKETQLSEDMKTSNIRIVDKAETPRFPVKPRKKLNVLLAMVVGLFLGVGLAFFFEYLDNTVKLPDDVKRYLGVPYLGPVPVMSHEAGDDYPDAAPELVTLHASKATSSEAYRGIRTSILFSSADHPPQTILTTSAGPQEGKTLSITNLAVTMAQSGNRVILLDCDMRKPRVHNLFGIPRDRGMSNILVGESNVKEAIMESGVPNLDVIPCGPIPPNPSEILGSKRMAKLLEVLRPTYQHILIDSPPITAVTDAVVLSKYADGVIVVVRAAETPREIVQNGIGQLKTVGAHILGVILNGVSMGKEGYYYYQYYYYYYGEDGKRKKKAERKKRHKGAYA